MKFQKILIIVFVILLCVFLISLLVLYLKKNQSDKTENLKPSPNILFLTQPVYNLSGTVESVKDNVITIKQNTTSQMSNIIISPNMNPAAIPTPETKTIFYQVIVDNNTTINRPTSNIPYLFTTPSPVMPVKLQISSIMVGDILNITATTDLRTTPPDQIKAFSIQLPQSINSLSGKITDVTLSSVSIKGYLPTPAITISANPKPAQEKIFVIAINPETEISLISTPEPKKLSLGDLKKDMQAIIYTAENITENQKITALCIELIIPPPLTSPVPTSGVK